MYPSNTLSSEKQVLVFLDLIKSKLDQLPASSLEGLAADLQTICSEVDCHADGARDFQPEYASSNAALVDEGMVIANAAMRKSQELLRVALANSPVAVFQTDLELRYTWFYSPYMGQTAEKLVGRRDDEIFPPESIAAFLNLKRRALNSEEIICEELLLPFDDQQRTLKVSVEPFYGAENVVSGVIGSLLDVTELRRLEAGQMESAFKLEVNRRLLEGREQERQLIARFIHDGPIQDLSSLGFSIQLARELSQNAEVSVVLEELGNGVKSLVGELREVTNELRPAGLIRFGLTNAIRVCISDFEKLHGNISVKLALEKAANYLPEDTCLALFRIFHEGMANISRHAMASEVSVRLSTESNDVIMEIQDNGKGFDPPLTWVDLTRKGCYGLVLMKERAESMGGKMEIQTCRNKGTAIQVRVQRDLPLIPVSGGGGRRTFVR